MLELLRTFFPWKLFRRFMLIQTAALTSVLLIVLILVRLYVSSYSAEIGPSGFAELDRLLRTVFVLAFLLFGLASMWIGIRLFLPLARLSKFVHSGRPGSALTEEDLGEDEPEEWSDIVLGFSKLSEKLQTTEASAKQEQEDVETLLGAIGESVIAVNPSGQIFLNNDQFTRLFVEGDLGTRHLREIIRTPEVLEAFQSTLESGEVNRAEVGLYLKREQYPRYFLLSVAPLRETESRGIYGALGIFHEITEMKRAEQIRIDFVANVSHELRTPITSIKGYTETLRSEIQNAAWIKYLDVITSNADRLISLVGDLLDLSSIESGGRFEIEEIPVRQLTEEVLTRLEGAYKGKRQTVDMDVKVEFIRGDYLRVEQVLANLVSNAIKYTPPASRIQVVWENAENGTANLRVVDNGPGISPEHLPRLFERFYRVDAARSREMGGTGLGLSIVKHIMRRHGGTVTVRSLLGKGTEFVCTFGR